MPRCWQIQQHAGPRASSWQHRCPADPRNAAPFPPSSPGDMAGRGGGECCRQSPAAEPGWQSGQRGVLVGSQRWPQDIPTSLGLPPSPALKLLIHCWLGPRFAV